MQTEAIKQQETKDKAPVNNGGNAEASKSLFEEYTRATGGDRNQLQQGSQNVGEPVRPDQVGAKLLDMLRAKTDIDALGFGKCTIDMDDHTVTCQNVAIKIGVKPDQKPELQAVPKPGADNNQKPGANDMQKRFDPPCDRPSGDFNPAPRPRQEDKPIKDPGFLRPLIPGKH